MKERGRRRIQVPLHAVYHVHLPVYETPSPLYTHGPSRTPLCYPGPTDQTTDRVAEQRRALLGPLLANPGRAEADSTREAALSESLTEFVTRQDDSVKAVVRLMKVRRLERTTKVAVREKRGVRCCCVGTGLHATYRTSRSELNFVR